MTAARPDESPRMAGHRRHQGGYVLPAVLVITAAIMIFVTLSHQRAADELQAVGQLVAARQGEIEQTSAQATVIYALVTEHASALGYGLTPGAALRVDGRTYAYGDRTLIRLQDTAGLVDINRADITVLRRLAGYVGVPADRRDVLADRILDFIDGDDLRRLNGAEAAEYAAAAVPPPRNRKLDQPGQLRGVLGWDTLLTAGQAVAFESALAIDTVGPINPNAAPAAVLTAALGIPSALADTLVARRHQGALLGEAEMTDAMPSLPASLILIIDPVASQRIRLTVFDRLTGAGKLTQMTLTPFGQDWPWTVDSAGLHSEADVSAAGDTAVALPALPTRKTNNESEPNRLL